MKKDDFKQMEKEISEKEKFFKLYKLEKKWIKNLQQGIDLNSKLVNSNINQIAIYGWGEMAWLLSAELDSEKIAYIIDRNAERISAPFPLYEPNEYLPDADLIVVSIIDQYEAIKEYLMKKVKIPICSLDDLVCEDKWCMKEK